MTKSDLKGWIYTFLGALAGVVFMLSVVAMVVVVVDGLIESYSRTIPPPVVDSTEPAPSWGETMLIRAEAVCRQHARQPGQFLLSDRDRDLAYSYCRLGFFAGLITASEVQAEKEGTEDKK